MIEKIHETTHKPIRIYDLPNNCWGVQAGENTLILATDEMNVLRNMLLNLDDEIEETDEDSLYARATLWDE